MTTNDPTPPSTSNGAYERRYLRLPKAHWDRLDKMAEDMGGTVTPDFFVAQALEQLWGDGARRSEPIQHHSV